MTHDLFPGREEIARSRDATQRKDYSQGLVSMSNDLRTQIYNNLASQDTKALLDIWQNGDVDEWDEQTFDIVKEILLERLGELPARSMQRQAAQILAGVAGLLQAGELDEALNECERAIQMMPGLAIAYNYRGEIHDELGQLENALVDYRTAIQLDPEFKTAWENMLDAEKEAEAGFQDSVARQYLDQALEYALNHEVEKTMEQCELAGATMPQIATAYNYLGMILEQLEQFEPAIDAYLKAIELNPRFYPARENLADARLRFEATQYRRTVGNTMDLEYDESLIPEGADGALLPQWVYLDEKAFLLPGWAGHRTRQGRSGYDPLETDFENARMQGVVIQRLIRGRFRTKNPIYLFFMTFLGLVLSVPLLGLTGLIGGNPSLFFLAVIYVPYMIAGIALLVNVFLSFLSREPTESEENGSAFF